MRTRLALSAASLAAALAVLGGAAPASAHVSIPDPAEQGGFSIVTLSVPNERPDAGTTTVEVKLPEDHPLPFVSTQPKPGWTVTTTTRTLDEPVEAFGEEVTEVVDTVTWTGGEIGDGEFDTFALSVGPLPDDVDQLAFPTIQTYSGGEEVAWIEVGDEGDDLEHPAPILRLVAPADDTDGAAAERAPAAERQDPAGDDDDDDGPEPVAIAALAVAVVAALLAAGALVSSRRTAR